MGSRRIEQRLLLALIGVVVAVLLPAVILLDRWLGDDVQAMVRESLNREAVVLAAELDRAPPADLPAWVANVPAAARVTVIATDGRVLADSDVPVEMLAQVENHRDRPEVARALGGLVGVQERKS